MRLPHHLFIGCEGALWDTRLPDWSGRAPLRPIYSRHYLEIANVHELKATVRAGGFAWPGGYPLFFITSDCAPLCFDCVRSEFLAVSLSVRWKLSDGWRVIGAQVNWEEPDLRCEHCSKPIESAYGEDSK